MIEQKPYTWRGETHTLGEWSKIVGIPRGTLYSRLAKYQWEVERALTEPIRKNNGRLVKVEKYIPKKRVEKKIALCTARCKRCYYGSCAENYVYCMYTAEEGHRRGCPAGDKCTKFSSKKKKKPNTDGLIRRMA